MNLRAAVKELGGRPPAVTFQVLALEAAVILSVSMLMVHYFA